MDVCFTLEGQHLGFLEGFSLEECYCMFPQKNVFEKKWTLNPGLL